MGVREMERFLEKWQMDARDLRRRMIRSPTPRERERWYALLLLAQGWTGSAVAEALERDPHTIGRWAAAFGEGGPAALIFEQSGGSPPPSARRALLQKSPFCSKNPSGAPFFKPRLRLRCRRIRPRLSQSAQ